MYEFQGSVPTVRINLSPGIYLFPTVSATGKTFLAKTLNRLRLYCQQPVGSFTYSDLVKYASPLEALSGLDYDVDELKVILFDRYDLYAGKFSNDIQSLGKSSIVLLDCKRVVDVDWTGMCDISLTPEKIEVKSLAFYI